MHKHLKSTPMDYRLHQHFNSIQFDGEGLLTLKEASKRGFLKLFTRPGYITTESTSSYVMNKKGYDAQRSIDQKAVIDPLGTGEKMTVEEALARELIRPITGTVMIGFEVV